MTSTPTGLRPADAATYAEWFAVLADPTRVRLLHRVASSASGAVRVGDLASALDISQATCSHHVRKLAEVGFVHVDKVGTSSLVSVNAACCTGLPHAADVVMGTLSSRPGPGDGPADVTTRAMTDADLPRVREIYAEGIATRQATFETEAPAIEALRGKWLPGQRWVAELVEELAGHRGHPSHLGVVGQRPRIEVDAPLVGSLGVLATAVPRVELHRRHLHGPDDRAELGDAELVGGPVPAREVQLHGLDPRGRTLRESLLVDLRPLDALGEPVQHAGSLEEGVDDARTDCQVVLHQVELGGSPVTDRREVDPVRVADAHDAVVDLDLDGRGLRGHLLTVVGRRPGRGRPVLLLAQQRHEHRVGVVPVGP